MTTKYYVTPSGDYLGGFLGVEPPPGSIQVMGPPSHGWQKYNLEQSDWIALTDEQKVLIENPL